MRFRATLRFLHFDLEKIGYECRVSYGLVLPLEYADIRGTFDHVGRDGPYKDLRKRWLAKDNSLRFPLGGTVVTSSDPDYPFHKSTGSIVIPFRDGAHAQWDSARLGGIPTYYTAYGSHYLLHE